MADRIDIQTLMTVSEVVNSVTGAARSPTPWPCTGGRETPEA